jgi:hypothetical protein
MDEDDDAASAELEYLKARELELMDRVQSLEKQLRVRLDRTTVGRVVAEIADVMGRSGNETLAAKYLAAFARWQTAEDACLRAVALGEGNAPGHEAMNEALQEFERIATEANRWLDEKRG